MLKSGYEDQMGVLDATSAIDILDILIAQTTVDYGTVGSPGSLKSNYGTL